MNSERVIVNATGHLCEEKRNMGRTKKIRWIACIVLVCAVFATACSSDIETKDNSSDTVETADQETIESDASSNKEDENSVKTTSGVMKADNLTQAVQQSDELGETTGNAIDENESLDQVQLNSAYMLNYLTVLSTEISSSNSSKVFLEETYSALINNTSPNVDEDTQEQLTTLLDILQKFRMLDAQRERTEYLYDQNCAQALKKAVPNPLGLLSAIESGSFAKTIASVAYMAIDSYSSYTSFVETAELEHLKETWKLEDAESEYLHENRSDAFDYMIEITREYSLPDDVSLTEKDVDTFVQWKNNGNTESKIQFFETDESKKKYQKFGPYWLTLVSSYYGHGDYQKCLDAIEEYEKLDCHIFRKDYEFAQTLPFAMAAADEILTGDAYVKTIDHYATEIINNSDQDDWKLRYLVAQSCLGLYARTNNIEYLENAYTITKNNVNNLVNEQRKENAEYMKKPKIKDTQSGFHPIANRDIKKENKNAINETNIQLPPVSQALLINCQLLFALSEELGISDSDKQSIMNIIHPNGEKLFLNETIDNLFWFEQESSPNDESKVLMSEDTITIPAKFLSENSSLKVTVYKGTKKELIEKWKIDSGSRANPEDVDTFSITYKSTEAHKYNYADVDRVVIEIIPDKDSNIEAEVFEFTVIAKGGIMNKVFKNYVFTRVD